jgi:hypothetical protein
MASDLEIDRTLASLTATLNDRGLEEFDPPRVQKLVNESLGDAGPLTIDAGGGLHDDTGKRIGAIRRTPSGEWIIDRQNPGAERSDAAIPR